MVVPVLPLSSSPDSHSQDQFNLQMLLKVPGDKMAWAQPLGLKLTVRWHGSRKASWVTLSSATPGKTGFLGKCHSAGTSKHSSARRLFVPFPYGCLSSLQDRALSMNHTRVDRSLPTISVPCPSIPSFFLSFLRQGVLSFGKLSSPN